MDAITPILQAILPLIVPFVTSLLMVGARSAASFVAGLPGIAKAGAVLVLAFLATVGGAATGIEGFGGHVLLDTVLNWLGAMGLHAAGKQLVPAHPA